MLVLYMFIALALTKSTVIGQVVEDEVDTGDMRILQQGPIEIPGSTNPQEDIEHYQKDIEKLKEQLDYSKQYTRLLEDTIKDKGSTLEKCLDPVQDCADIFRLNPRARTGLHNINIHRVGLPSERLLVYCDMETDGGGWTVIQRRHNDVINFDRDFETYREGFGIMTNDFWLGNENLQKITSRSNYQLKIELENFQGEKRTANYGVFNINCGSYKMKVGFYSGDAGDALRDNHGMSFSTFDHDEDLHPDLNCANHHQGAWWHNACTRANLNGRYVRNPVSHEQNIFWHDWQGHMSLKATEMKIRPAPIQQPTTRRDCADILKNNPRATSGQYTIYSGNSCNIKGSMQVYCDMDTDGGGWTVFQRRQDGSVDFFRNYQSYREGFGDVNEEFWLGNDNLHQLTNGCDQELRFDLMDDNNDRRYAHYASFHVGSYDDGYRMDVSTYNGTAGDAFTMHDGMMFSTYNRDQDTWGGNCAASNQGAWWYLNCFRCNLNGRYFTQHPPDSHGVAWLEWTGSGDEWHLRFTEMKIRPSGSCI